MSIERGTEALPVAFLAEELRGQAKHNYAAARELYGWRTHEHHYADKPVLLTRSQFADAVERAGAYPSTELLDIAVAKG